MNFQPTVRELGNGAQCPIVAFRSAKGRFFRGAKADNASPDRSHVTHFRVRRRTGAALVAVLVCLMVVIMLAGLLVQSIMARQRQVRVEEQRSQAAWLAESAVERGAALLKKDAEYKGESWSVPAEELGQRKGGQAIIQVEAVEGAPRRRKLIVEGIYPDDPFRRIAVRKQVFVDLPASGETP